MRHSTASPAALARHICLIGVATWLASCGGESDAGILLDAPACNELPGFNTLPDQRSASSMFVRNGAEFLDSGGAVSIGGGGTTALFSPGVHGLAWALYKLSQGLHSTPQGDSMEYSGEGWLGIGSYKTGAWYFVELSGSSPENVGLVGLDVLSTMGNCYFAALCHDASTLEVHSLALSTAEEGPQAYAYALPHQGWAPLTVYLSAFGSMSPEGIASYEWDMDGDGSFETDATAEGGYIDATFDTHGDYTVSLRVIDNKGAMAEASVDIHIWDPAESTVDYGFVFDDSQVRRIDIAVSQADWYAMWDEPLAELEVPAMASIFGEELPSPVGFRMKGNSTLWMSGAKKSWKLDINEYDDGQDFHNLKMLILNNNWNDPSQCREKMAYDMFQAAGVPASHVCHVEVYIDVGGAGPEYWGVYSMVERADKKFLANRFESKEGNLYKAMGRAELTWRGDSYESYKDPSGDYTYEMETNSGSNDGSDLIALINAINNTDDGDFKGELEKVFNVDGFLRYYAANKCICALDDYACMSHNYYIYNDPETGLFEWIPWDLNSAFGIFGTPQANAEAPLYDIPPAGMGGPHPAPLFERMMEVPEYRQRMAAYIDLLRRHQFQWNGVRAAAKHWHDLLAPYVALEDKVDYFTYEHFDINWDQDFVAETVQGNPRFYFGIGNLARIRNGYIDIHLIEDL